MIDTHCHLSHPDFDTDRESVLANCWENGVAAILEVGYSLDTSRQALELAKKHPVRLRSTAGIHPHEAGAVTDEDFAAVAGLLDEPEVIAVGETGLDFYRDWSPRDRQVELFGRSVVLAVEHNLPVIVHDRDAHDEVLRILREEGRNKVRGIFHCFSGDLRVAQEAIALGFYLGLGGSITYWSRRKKGRLLKDLPLERILLETDAPWLTPQPERGRRNDSTKMTHVVARLAEAHKVDPETILKHTSENTRRLFPHASPWPPEPA